MEAITMKRQSGDVTTGESTPKSCRDPPTPPAAAWCPADGANSNASNDRLRTRRAVDDGVLIAELRSELAECRCELERKDTLARSLQAQFEQMEQRCSVLEQALEDSDARAKEFHRNAFAARVEIDRLSAELYSRGNSQSVIDAEVAFDREIRRVNVKAKREVDALTEKAEALRERLEDEKSVHRLAWMERNACREEAEEAAETIKSMREEISSWERRSTAFRHEKARLERSVKKHSDRAKVIELEHQRVLRVIDELHDSTMAIALEAGINMAG